MGGFFMSSGLKKAGQQQEATAGSSCGIEKPLQETSSNPDRATTRYRQQAQIQTEQQPPTGYKHHTQTEQQPATGN